MNQYSVTQPQSAHVGDILQVALAQDPLRTPRDLPNATKFRAMRAEGAADDTSLASGPPSLGYCSSLIV